MSTRAFPKLLINLPNIAFISFLQFSTRAKSVNRTTFLLPRLTCHNTLERLSVNICPQTFVKELLTTCLCVTLSHRCQTMCHWITPFIKKRTDPTHSPPTACPKTAPGLFKLSPFSNFPVPSSKNCTAKGLQPKTLQVDLTAPDSDCLTRNCFGIGAGAFRSFLRPGVAVPAHSCTTSYIRARSYAKRRIWADFPLFASQLLLFFQLTTDGEVLDTEFYFHSEFDWFRWIQWLGCDF